MHTGVGACRALLRTSRKQMTGPWHMMSRTASMSSVVPPKGSAGRKGTRRRRPWQTRQGQSTPTPLTAGPRPSAPRWWRCEPRPSPRSGRCTRPSAAWARTGPTRCRSRPRWPRRNNKSAARTSARAAGGEQGSKDAPQRTRRWRQSQTAGACCATAGAQWLGCLPPRRQRAHVAWRSHRGNAPDTCIRVASSLYLCTDGSSPPSSAKCGSPLNASWMSCAARGAVRDRRRPGQTGVAHRAADERLSGGLDHGVQIQRRIVVAALNDTLCWAGHVRASLRARGCECQTRRTCVDEAATLAAFERERQRHGDGGEDEHVHHGLREALPLHSAHVPRAPLRPACARGGSAHLRGAAHSRPRTT